MTSIKKVAVIGTGVIGTGWIIRYLAHNKIVYAFDKNLKLNNFPVPPCFLWKSRYFCTFFVIMKWCEL